MKKLDARGFSVTEVILCVLLLGLIGGTGYYISTKQQSNKVNTVQQEPPSGKKVQSPGSSFSINIADNWTHKDCKDLDAIILMPYENNEPQECAQSDAIYPEDGWWVYGKAVVGVEENGYSRPEGTKTDTIELKNGNSAERLTYRIVIDKSTGEELTVTEYIIEGRNKTVTAKAFDSITIRGREPKIVYEDLLLKLEDSLGTLVN